MGGINTKEVAFEKSNTRTSTATKPKSTPMPKFAEPEAAKKPEPTTVLSDNSNDPEDELNKGDKDFDPENYDPATVGPILPNGEINWDCPCMAGGANGPCGTQFRDAFSCYHYSEEEVKGSDCFTQFLTVSECFSKHPELYGRKEGADDVDLEFDDDELELIDREGKSLKPEVKEKDKEPEEPSPPVPQSQPKPEKKSEKEKPIIDFPGSPKPAVL